MFSEHSVTDVRFAKSQLDERSFFGTHLQACYAPELETLEETVDKLRWRRNHYRNGLNRSDCRCDVTSALGSLFRVTALESLFPPSSCFV